jgi:hypothetical protein
MMLSDEPAPAVEEQKKSPESSRGFVAARWRSLRDARVPAAPGGSEAGKEEEAAGGERKRHHDAKMRPVDRRRKAE